MKISIEERRVAKKVEQILFSNPPAND